MKKMKYIIGIILFMIGFLFTGELFILYLDTFQDSYYRTEFTFTDLPKDISDEIIINDFLNSGQNNGIEFFIVDNKINSLYSSTITIYGTDEAIRYLKTRDILEKKYTSLFLGEVEVYYVPFNNISNIKNIESVFIIGDSNKLSDMQKFKAELIDKYGGGFPRLYGSEKETYINLLFVWGIVFILIFLMSVYDMIYQKKENIIKLILGGDLKQIFFKNLIMDISIFLSVFLLFSKILSNFSNVTFKLSYISIIFIIFLLFDLLVLIDIFKVDIKKDFANSKNDNKVFQLNYILKYIINTIAIILLSGNIVIITEAFSYFSQKSFFEKYKNYAYYQINYKTSNELKSTTDSCIIHQTLYERFQDKSLEYIDLSKSINSNYPLVLMNKLAKDKLVSEFDDLKIQFEKMNAEKLYILVPENAINNIEELDEVKQIYDFYFNNKFENNAEILLYTNPIKIVAINNYLHLYVSKTIKNPIILIDNTKQEIDEISAERQIYYAYNVMYNIPENEFENFIAEFQLQNEIVVKSNALDVYLHNLAIIKRSAKIISILLMFLIFLEIVMIVVIIKLEYSINAIEMSLKKILGYNLFERNKKIILITLISSISNIIMAFVLNFIFKIPESMYLLWSGVILFVIEMFFIYIKVKNIERTKIPTILKGERL